MRLSKRLLLSLTFTFSTLIAAVAMPANQAKAATASVIQKSPGYNFCIGALNSPVSVAFPPYPGGDYWSETVYVGSTKVTGGADFQDGGFYSFTDPNATWYASVPLNVPANTIVTVTFYMSQAPTTGPNFDFGFGASPLNGQTIPGVDAYDTVNINCTTGLISGRPVYVPPPPPLGPQVPSNFVLHLVSCTSKLYWAADPKATVNGNDQIIAGQRFYVSPTAVKGTDGKQWTPIFVGSFDLVYVPTECVFPNQVVVNSTPPPSGSTSGGYAPTFGFNR